MKIKFLTYLFLGFGLLVFPKLSAQIEENLEEQDSISSLVNENEFQVKFFKALSERGIENYEKAVEILEELKKDNEDEKPVIYFQLGLNYFDLEKYNLALENLKKAESLKPENFDIREAIFKVYEQQKNYTEAINLAQTLAKEKAEYHEILANLFLITAQYQKALDALNQADVKQGFDAYKDELRQVIFEEYNKPKVAADYYQKRIDQEPYNPMNAYRLTSFLMQDSQYNEALQASQNLIKNHPRFTRAYVLQTQIYLELNQIQNALNALETVVSNRFLEEEYKIQAIEYFKTYVDTHPEAQNDFVEVLNVASQTAEDTSSYLDLGLYYFETDKPRALDNFKKALEQNPQDFQILKNIVVLQFQLEQYNEVITTADSAMEIYPTQAVFMLIKGEALLNLTQYNEAIDVLLEASTYIFEENNLMLGLYESLSSAYKSINNEEKAKIYKDKADKLRPKLN